MIDKVSLCSDTKPRVFAVQSSKFHFHWDKMSYQIFSDCLPVNVSHCLWTLTHYLPVNINPLPACELNPLPAYPLQRIPTHEEEGTVIKHWNTKPPKHCLNVTHYLPVNVNPWTLTHCLPVNVNPWPACERNPLPACELKPSYCDYPRVQIHFYPTKVHVVAVQLWIVVIELHSQAIQNFQASWLCSNVIDCGLQYSLIVGLCVHYLYEMVVLW